MTGATHGQHGWGARHRRRRLATAFLLSAFGASAVPFSAQAYCPSYTLSSSDNDYDCGHEAVPGTNPSNSEWLAIFDIASRGPEAWGSAGPDVSDIGQGCGKPEAYHKVPARFPCELIMAIARHESGWRQFCVPDRPDDQIGKPSQTIISFDCGYGVGQVTSGMHIGENPTYDPQRVVAEPLYNMATGTRILASKWGYTECVGDNQPRIIEHWYSATWAYNGLAYKNNPNNPDYDANRGVWDPDIGGSAPYQEKVFGRMEHTGGLWTSTPVAYPNPGEIGTGSKPPELTEPYCASPTDCTNTRPVHETTCDGQGGAGGATPDGGSGVGGGNNAVGGSGGGPPVGTGGRDDSMADEPDAGIPGANDGCGCRVRSRGPIFPPRHWLLFLTAVAFSMRRLRRDR